MAVIASKLSYTKWYCSSLNCFYAATKLSLTGTCVPAFPTACRPIIILVLQPFQSGNEPFQCIVRAHALAERAAGMADIESWSAAPNSIHVM